MRNATAALLLLVLLAPLAQARMTIEPSSIEVEAGGSAEFSVHLLNVANRPLTFAIETDDPGLWVTLDRTGATIDPGAEVALVATVRAPPWAYGERVVRIVLYEDGDADPVETQEVRVRVTSSVAASAATGAIAGMGAGALAGLVAWRRWHFVAFALYSRIAREHLERHPSRARLVDIVRRSPGVSLADAQRASGLANGPFEHHLGKLVASGRVVVIEHGRARLLRLAESGPLALAPGTAASVAGLVRSRGQVRAADVARELGLSRQALHYHVRQLAEQGIIDARIERGRLVLSSHTTGT